MEFVWYRDVFDTAANVGESFTQGTTWSLGF